MRDVRKGGQCRQGGRMKRAAISPSSKPMKRSPMASGSVGLRRSGALAPGMGMSASTAMPRRSRGIKSRGPKMTPIRKSANGEECTLAIPGICKGDTSTTVWCHSNLLADGKGMGLKAPDEAGCYGCADCHAFYDGGWAAFPSMTRERVNQYFELARTISRLKLERKGLIKA